ncbi:MAG: putative glycoside hydrolase [Patescibacteria group bacterium]
MKKLYIFFLLTVISTSTLLASNRLSVYWQTPTMTSNDARNLAKFDLVIVDVENWANNPETVAEILKYNSDCVLLKYINPMELFDPQVDGRPWQGMIYNSVTAFHHNWWLKQPNGAPIYYWHSPRMRMLNLSSKCPVDKHGNTWGGYLVQHMKASADAEPIAGLFIDNTFDNISWMYEGNIDVNCDGLRDHPDSLDLWWRQGVEKFLQLLESDLVIGNEANLEYKNLLDGKMWENFPPADFGKSWYASMQNYLSELSEMEYNIIHSEPKGEQWRMFTLCSALLGDGLYCYGTNHYGWYPEYNLIKKLGKPVGPAQSSYMLVWGQVINNLYEKKVVSDSLPAGEYIVSYKYSLVRRPNQLVCEAVSKKYGGIFPYSQQIHERWLEGFIHQKVTLTSKGRIVWRSQVPAVISDMEIKLVQKLPWVRKYEHGEVLVYPDEQRGEIRIYK